jgi:hypothetical protein
MIVQILFCKDNQKSVFKKLTARNKLTFQYLNTLIINNVEVLNIENTNEKR